MYSQEHVSATGLAHCKLAEPRVLNETHAASLNLYFTFWLNSMFTLTAKNFFSRGPNPLLCCTYCSRWLGEQTQTSSPCSIHSNHKPEAQIKSWEQFCFSFFSAFLVLYYQMFLLFFSADVFIVSTALSPFAFTHKVSLSITHSLSFFSF